MAMLAMRQPAHDARSRLDFISGLRRAKRCELKTQSFALRIPKESGTGTMFTYFEFVIGHIARPSMVQ